MRQEEVAFFDSYADKWDEIRQADDVKLNYLVDKIKLLPGASIIDVGSGTGVLLPYLYQAIGEGGQILAVDFSAKMLAKAQEKYSSATNITFCTADILELPLQSVTYDAVICLNFFPHLQNNKQVYAEKMFKVLQKGGKLVIMHDISRDQVNGIHGDCEAVKEHRLPPAEIIANMLTAIGYKIINCIDNNEVYLLVGEK